MAKGIFGTELIPKDILPIDDAYHGSNKHIASEWWYFDAVFSNNYSLHVGFTTFSKTHRIASSAIEIYKDGKLEVKAIKRYLFQDIQVSKNFLFVKLSDKKIMEFDLERFNEKGEWVYNFSNKIDDHEVDLTFIGTTKGWKFETDAECWAVALPKAHVTGDITVKGKKMSVEGFGYHDHNWNSTLSSILSIWGWYWGKVTGETLNLVWMYVMRTPKERKLGAVINQDGQGYFYINPEKIHFKTDKFIRSHGRKIPTHFIFQIDDIVNNTPIKGDIKIEIKDSYFKSVLIAPYWRHHIKATGSLSIGAYKEDINSTHIMESFRLF